MDSLSIKGGVPLHGEVAISGAKNAVLPIMAASLLTAEPCVNRRVPRLSDVSFMGQILTSLGAKVNLDGDTLKVQAVKIKGVGDYDLIRKMRGSICILGPLLGRLRRASVSLPGGCVFVAAAAELDDRDGPVRASVVSQQRGLLQAIARAAKLAVEVGHFRRDLDVEQFAFEFLAIYLAFHHAQRLLRDPRAEQRARRAYMRLVDDAAVRH